MDEIVSWLEGSGKWVQWVFSGIGVLIITLLYNKWSERKAKGDDYDSDEIIQKFEDDLDDRKNTLNILNARTQSLTSQIETVASQRLLNKPEILPDANMDVIEWLSDARKEILDRMFDHLRVAANPANPDCRIPDDEARVELLRIEISLMIDNLEHSIAYGRMDLLNETRKFISNPKCLYIIALDNLCDTTPKTLSKPGRKQLKKNINYLKDRINIQLRTSMS